MCSFFFYAHYVSWKEANTNKNTRRAVQPRSLCRIAIGQSLAVLSREVSAQPIRMKHEGTLNNKYEQLKKTAPAPLVHYHLIANSNFHVLELYFINWGITLLRKLSCYSMPVKIFVLTSGTFKTFVPLKIAIAYFIFTK